MIKILRLLRTEAGLTQAALAKELDVTRDLIARIENNLQKITDDILEKYVNYFRVERAKLYALVENHNYPFEYLLRAKHGEELTPELKARFENWYERMEIYSLQAPLLPILQTPDDTIFKNEDGSIKNPRALATELRQFWSLGNTPIHDPVALVESCGCFIHGEDLGTQNLSAITGRRGPQSKPGILINTNSQIPIERQRFSIIHELGHILFHADYFTDQPDYSGYGKNKEEHEKFTDEFTGNFLVPADEFKRLYNLLLESRAQQVVAILVLKRHFKVSYQTIIYRLHELGFISDNQKNILFASFKKHFGISEPLPLTEPLNFQQMGKLQGIIKERFINITDESADQTDSEIITKDNPLLPHRALFGDYQVDLQQLWEVLQGERAQAGEWDFERLFKRLLEGLTWYELINLVPVEKIKAHLTESVIKGLYPPGRREYYDRIRRILQGQTLPTNGWLSENSKITKPAILSNRWYSPQSSLPSA